MLAPKMIYRFTDNCFVNLLVSVYTKNMLDESIWEEEATTYNICFQYNV